jgi:putative molybdopterin biosynthesis protein
MSHIVILNMIGFAYMTLKIRIGMNWEIGGSNLDLAVISQLLEAIAETGTVRAAADKLRISYRTVWGKLEAAEVLLGKQLVVKNKGHGSVLTQSGEQLKSLVINLTRSLKSGAQQEQEYFENCFRSVFASEPRKLRLACSHDIVFEECMQDGVLPDWDIRFMGSQKALDALRAGTVDLAGFHLPEKIAGQPGMKELWADHRYFVAPIMFRELGLVVAQGNPLNIRSIEDLVRPGVRFINRQGNAGTRLRLDELLRSKDIDPKAIHGYGHEEFTHSGVALAVAAGVADAAFALRAATSNLAVDFISVGRETYCVCGGIEIAADARYQSMLRHISDRLEINPGYSKPLAAIDSNGRIRGNPIASIARWEVAS